jgi:hypothetical protein
MARAYLRWDQIRVEDPYVYVRRGLVNARTDRWRRRVPIPTEVGTATSSVPTTPRTWLGTVTCFGPCAC